MMQFLSGTIADSRDDTTIDFTCCILHGCAPITTCNVDEFVRASSQIVRNRQNLQINEDTSSLTCELRFVRCYLLKIDELLNQEVDRLITTHLDHMQRGSECTTIAAPLLQACCDFCPVKEELHEKSPLIGSDDNILKVLTGETDSYLAGERKLINQNGSTMAQNVFQFLDDNHKSQLVENLRLTSDRTINLVVKQLFYERVVRDICLNSVHLLYERVARTVSLLFGTNNDMMGLIQHDLKLCDLMAERTHLRKAIIEAHLCRYLHMATVSTTKEGNAIKVQIDSLESIDELKDYLKDSC